MTASLSRYAATFVLVSILASVASAAEQFAVFKSTDRGRSWIHADAGLPAGSRINAFGSLDGVVFAGTDSGIYISGDEARSWKAGTGAAVSSGRVISFAPVGQLVFAGTDGNGLLVSLDKGKSWVLNTNFPSRKVRCLVAGGGKVYAGTDAEGVFASADGGQVWTQFVTGLPAHAQVFALSMIDGHLFAGLYGKGLYVWNDQAQRWSKRGAVSPLVLAASGGTLVAGHNPGGLHWSRDLGVSWSKGRSGAGEQVTSLLPISSGELSDNAPVWELAANDELVLAGASAGVFYSEDRGRTWTRARMGLPDESPGISFLVERTFVLAGTRIASETGKKN